MTAPYLKDNTFLNTVNASSVQEMFVKIILLDMKENALQEIQGKISDGSISIDGSSSVRRTGSLTFIPDEKESNLTSAENLISINKKMKLEIGYTNNFGQYIEYPILWFPMGIYIITDANSSISTTGATVSLQFQDKMTLLNGFSGGTFSAATTLDTDADNNPILIYDIIKELVCHIGGEDPNKVIISDIENWGKQVLQWNGNNPMYLVPVVDGNETYYVFRSASAGSVYTVQPGAPIGYAYTDFTYPGELVATADQTVCDILNTIRDTLGNFEYFYDLEGNFRFQEIKNYLNTSQASLVINQMNNNSYLKDNSNKDKAIYSFNDNNLISSLANTPSYANIKNDFIVWGSRQSLSGVDLLIRYHLVIDQKPILTSGANRDWRQLLYEDTSSYYNLELSNEWPKLYNCDNNNLAPIYNDVGVQIDLENLNTWKTAAINDPTSIDYFLDFIDTTSGLNELNVQNIGRRTKVLIDNTINCLFAPTVPGYVIAAASVPAQRTEANNKGEKCIVIPDVVLNGLSKGYAYNDAFTAVRDMLYQYTSYNTAISLTTIPIYHLDVNTLISVSDIENGISGNFTINSLTIPLAPSGQMSISASATKDKI